MNQYELLRKNALKFKEDEENRSHSLDSSSSSSDDGMASKQLMDSPMKILTDKGRKLSDERKKKSSFSDVKSSND